MTPEELLSQLQDIHEPATIGFWPLAPGWWVLIIMAICFIILIAYLCRRHIKNNSWKKEAAKTLAELKKQASEQEYQRTLFQVNQLLKQVAMYKHNDTSIKALTGEAWYTFLAAFLNGPHTPNMFTKAQLTLLTEGLYKQAADSNQSMNTEVTQLLKTLNEWIKEA
ncbi:DUF4381 domain-containing protein [Alkalimarinus sediminis]|uniref:DUF4381 domain-containing protein n=1 Tax=Alkalimarinus sediminis TaxID=1632866 RepID=A0A9E8HKG7_9ALTE|nr:DUF4381 domain-containing protein [Alkalimarinus sediminis]UZW75797.1 DUF4381 domain-containing protein [Alkalimarinus sediminis]